MHPPSFFQPFSSKDDGSPDAFIEPPDVPTGCRELQEEMERRIVCDDFTRIGIAPDMNLTADELVMKLKKSRREYDEKIIRAIYATVAAAQSFGSKNFVNARQVVDAYLKRKRELTTMVESCHREVDEISRLLAQAEQNLSRLQEGTAAQGGEMAEESKLTIQVVSVQNLAEDATTVPNCRFKIHLECQQQVIETKAVYMAHDVCYFNEMFSFEISRAEGPLLLRLVEVEPYAGSESVIGDCACQVSELIDQKRHDMTKELWGLEASGAQVKGDVVLSMQWVYSKLLLYQNHLRECTARRSQKLQDLTEYQNELDRLSKPFLSDDSTPLQGIFAAGPEYVSQSLDKLLVQWKLNSWQLASQYVVIISLLLAGVASSSRAVFLDQMVAVVAFWSNLDASKWSPNRYAVLIGASAWSLVVDFYWMRIYFQVWSLGSVEADLHNITKFFSVFLFLWKVVVIVLFWKCRYDLVKKVMACLSVC
eukprot:GHVT01061511.1.p1 GENE.GHVT01061511.1~~GHVT01061511.1.p1  ORF type:complete len:479 (-),score=87.32 GHVT01061511.1:1311-2747(-)